LPETATPSKPSRAKLNTLFSNVLSLRDEAQRQRTILAGIGEKLQKAEQQMLDGMQALGLSSYQDTRGNRAGRSEWLWAAPRDEDALFRWLRATGHGKLIKRTVNGQSLSAHIRRLRSADAAIPDFVEITTRPRLIVRRV